MANKNDQTIKTYQENFSKYAERSPSEISGGFKKWIDSFISELPENGRILELGSATGRDARYLKSKGFRMVCTDIIQEALEKLSGEGFETKFFNFRDELPTEWVDKFDGLYANAVFVHATQEEFGKLLFSISKIVKKSGIIAFSLLMGEGEAISMDKLDAPRYYKYYSEKEVKEILSKFEYEIISMGYGDDKWLCIILRNL